MELSRTYFCLKYKLLLSACYVMFCQTIKLNFATMECKAHWKHQEHQLIFKQWPSNGSYVLIKNGLMNLCGRGAWTKVMRLDFIGIEAIQDSVLAFSSGLRAINPPSTSFLVFFLQFIYVIIESFATCLIPLVWKLETLKLLR